MFFCCGRVAIMCFVISLALGCGDEKPGQHNPLPEQQALVSSLEQLLISTLKKIRNDSNHELSNNTFGIILHVDTPRLDFVWSGAAGHVSDAGKELLSPQHPVRIASISKVYIAATVLRLWEEGRLQLDDPIKQFLTKSYVSKLSASGYKPESITVKHLLTHTSGIVDYAMTESFAKAVNNNPSYRWSRAEQLNIALKSGAPIGPAGQQFSYSDTGYILLGDIIEQVTEQPLAMAMRSLLSYKSLGLTMTWLESLEPVPESVRQNRAHQFVVDQDTYHYDPSLDLYGGGGIAATIPDVAKFFRALFEGKVYVNPYTLDAMLMLEADESELNRLLEQGYRQGIRQGKFNETEVYHHGGYWGTFAAYVPKYDLVICLSINQQLAKKEKQKLFVDALNLIEEAVVRREEI